MRFVFFASFLILLTACTPGDVVYCENQGLRPQTPEWAKCFSYYHRNKQVFEADRTQCMDQARDVYPDSLYADRLVRRPVFDNRGVYRGTHVDNEPNWQQHRQVDRLREKIIAPCMAKKGWNDAKDWQAGGRKIR